MKKKLLSMIVAALVVCVFLAMPVAAEDQELTDQVQTGDTEVDANITDPAGEVAYIVTIPEKIDFGKLVCPETDTDSPAIQKFAVKCEKMQGVQKILVSVCNEGSIPGELGQKFYLTNMTNASCDFAPEYDLYVGNTVEEATKIDINAPGGMPVNGFAFVSFAKEGQSVGGGVSLNQRQLYPHKAELASIAGSYQGTMVFTIAAQ